VSARHEFAAGLAAIAPAAIAAAPIGLLFGALAAQKGLTPLEVGLMSALVFAGGSQFVAIEMWSVPPDWIGLALAALMVNARHTLMGASLAPKLHRFPRALLPLVVFPMADEPWALAERRAALAPLTPAYYAGLTVVFYLNWQVWSVTGALFGAVIDNPATYGFDFVFTALFIALLAGFWTGLGTGAILAASGLAATLVKLTVPGPWYVLAGALAGVIVAAAIARPYEER
jgi:4-azaleucine resistance transporter AzlC